MITLPHKRFNQAQQDLVHAAQRSQTHFQSVHGLLFAMRLELRKNPCSEIREKIKALEIQMEDARIKRDAAYLAVKKPSINAVLNVNEKADGGVK